MIAANQLENSLRDNVWEILMMKHRHQNEKRVRHKDEGGSRIHLPFVRSLADIGKKYSEPKSLVAQGAYAVVILLSLGLKKMDFTLHCMRQTHFLF